MILSLIGYDPAGVWTKTVTTMEELAEWKNPAGVTWINVESLDIPEASDDLSDGVTNEGLVVPAASEVTRLAEYFGIHPLTVEDMLDSTHQRPKVEEFDNYIFAAFKAVKFSEDLNLEHIGLVITHDTVLTFQNKSGNYVEGIKKRIINNVGRVRRMGADYLAYMIMDAVVDEYFISIEAFAAEIEEFEDRALHEKDDEFIQDIQEVKRNLVKMRRAVWPLRESISQLMHMESRLISDDLSPFLKDLYDHIIQAAETVDTYRELIAGIIEINMTVASNRLNQVIKVLTIISTIFIPLTFIVGVYGMNFDFMPELRYAPAYFIVWGIMLAIAIGMLVFFKRRKWI